MTNCLISAVSYLLRLKLPHFMGRNSVLMYKSGRFLIEMVAFLRFASFLLIALSYIYA